MKKTIGELIDQLGIINIKIFYLVDKVHRDEHTREDAKKIQDLNKLRSELINEISGHFDERKDVKIYNDTMTFFIRPSFIGNYHRDTKHLHTVRLSSKVRGEEIAQYLGAHIIDIRAYPRKTADGVCIHIKPTGGNRLKPGHYVDYLDGGKFDAFLKENPEVNIIAASQNSYDVLKKMFPNKITLIPCHHINFERTKRMEKKIDTCGYIGSTSAAATEVYKKIGQEIEKLGMKFITCFDFRSREDALNLYKNIDILVVGGWEFGDPNPHKIPTKLINAASFGIPSVAFPLAGYKEIEGYYTRARNMKELIHGVEKLRDAQYYRKISDEAYTMAERYHIKNIAGLYRKLT